MGVQLGFFFFFFFEGGCSTSYRLIAEDDYHNLVEVRFKNQNSLINIFFL